MATRYYIRFGGCSSEHAHANLYTGDSPSTRNKIGEIVLTPGDLCQVYDKDPYKLQLGAIYELKLVGW